MTEELPGDPALPSGSRPTDRAADGVSPRRASIPIAAEFGHVFVAGRGVRLDAWGVGPFVITTGGKSFRFEDSDRFGPSLVKRNGDIRANPWPPQNSAFWLAHACWRRQGRRLQDDGVTCVFDAPRPTLYRKVGRKNFIVKLGDEDGGFIEIASTIAARRAETSEAQAPCAAQERGGAAETP